MAFEDALVWSLGLLLGIAGLLALGWSWKTPNNKKDMKGVLNFFGIALVGLFLLGAFGFIPSLTNPLGGVQVPAGTDTLSAVATTAVGECLSTSKSTVTLGAVNPFTGSATAGTHRYRVNGGPMLTVSDAGTFTASPGDKLDILWYNASTSGGYFSKSGTYTVPCEGTFTVTESGKPIELYNNGTITLQVFNQEGVLITNSGDANETLAAGEVTPPLKFEVLGTFQRGMPYGGALLVEYNTSEVDDVIVNIGGTNLVAVSAQLDAPAAVDHAQKWYKVPAVLSSQILEGTIVIDADDTINPGAADDIDLVLYQYNYFINDDKGGAFELGVEDEDNVATQPTNVITATLATD